jgi:4-hydroxy-tetrahydrodipicolinate reductase
MAEKTRVLVSGALGRMGMETVKAIIQDNDLQLVAAVDIKARGERVSDITGLKDEVMLLENDLDKALEQAQPHVMVDFTNPQAVFNNVRSALMKVLLVVGTTG